MIRMTENNKLYKIAPWIILFSSLVLFVLEFFVFSKLGLIGNTVFWVAIPFLILYLLKIKPKEIGVALPMRKDIVLIVLLFFLGSLIAFYSVTIQEMMNYYSLFSLEITVIVIWVILVLCTEFFFRGFMLFGLEKKFGRYSALIQAFPYMLIHLYKPWPELYFSFFAGIALGLINLRSRSVIPSIIIHLSGLEIVILAQL